VRLPRPLGIATPDTGDLPLDDLSDSAPPVDVAPPAAVKLYRCHCQKAILGFHVSYQFYAGDAPFMCATVSGSQVKIARTAAPETICAIMKVQRRKSLFRLETVEPGTIFVCEVTTVRQPIRYERYFVAHLQIGERARRLHSKMPKKGAGGRYMINFGGKFTQRSIKNSILVDENEQNAIIVRRISEQDIEVESAADFPDVVAFAFAIVAWRCPY
jgi:hypothetical protein